MIIIIVEQQYFLVDSRYSVVGRYRNNQNVQAGPFSGCCSPGGFPGCGQTAGASGHLRLLLGARLRRYLRHTPSLHLPLRVRLRLPLGLLLEYDTFY